MDYAELETLAARHAGWQLLRHADAPLAASFLHRTFIGANIGALSRESLLEALGDELYALRRRFGDDAFPRCAVAYVDDWAAPESGWLRRFYAQGCDEPLYELTPATAQALGWLAQLDDAAFAGVDSRLQVLVDLLEHMRERADPDAGRRLEALRRRREAIDTEIAQAEAGVVAVLDAPALQDRLRQLVRLSDELLLDFRRADDALRRHDRDLRARVAAAGEGLPQAEDALPRALHDSDASRSVRAAWERLVGHGQHEPLSEALAAVLAVPGVAALHTGERLCDIPYAWLEASERARRALAERAEGLARFAARRDWEAQREIADVWQRIEARALAWPDRLTDEAALAIPAITAARPQPPAPSLAGDAIDAEAGLASDEAGDDELPVDRDELARRVDQALQTRSQVTLRELADAYPLRLGLAELLAYVMLAQTRDSTRIVADTLEPVAWESIDCDGAGVRREAALPRIVFAR